jgi:hypothetical protein
LPREQLTLITTTRSLQKAKKTNRVPKWFFRCLEEARPKGLKKEKERAEYPQKPKTYKEN